MVSFRARWGLSRLNPGTVTDDEDAQRMRLPKQLSVSASTLSGTRDGYTAGSWTNLNHSVTTACIL